MIQCENLMKIYKIDDENEVIALQGLDLTVKRGEMMGIVGSSGSGKSTLLNMLGGLDRPTAGRLIVNGQDLLRLSDKELVKYKLETVGFVWQNNARNLIPYLSAVENVEMPMLIKGKHSRKRAIQLLEMVGLGHALHHKIDFLSGGEQQRVAIAIALSNNPQLLLADEPTGSVDSATADVILDVFRNLNEELGLTIVIVTHDTELTEKMDRVVAIRDGKTSSEFLRRSYYEQLNRLRSDGEDQDVSEVEEDSHVELAVLDSAKRLQIPEEYLVEIGVTESNKVLMEVQDGKIVILNPQDM